MIEKSCCFLCYDHVRLLFLAFTAKLTGGSQCAIDYNETVTDEKE